MAIATPYFQENNEFHKRKFVFFVEGVDDAYFLSHLFTELNFSTVDVGIVQVRGNKNFANDLKQFLKTAAFTSGVTRAVSVICDADQTPQETLVAANAVLTATNNPSLALGSFTTCPRGIKFGFFAFPDSSNTGDLEKLCLDTVAGTALELSAQQFLSDAMAQAQQDGKQLTGSLFKRKAQVYLAGHTGEMCRGAGRAYSNGLFAHNHPSLDPLKSFLSEAVAVGSI